MIYPQETAEKMIQESQKLDKAFWFVKSTSETVSRLPFKSLIVSVRDDQIIGNRLFYFQTNSINTKH